MTKIPVDYAYEEIWKVSESKEDKKMKGLPPAIDTGDELDYRRICRYLTVGILLALAFIIGVLTTLIVDGNLKNDSANQAQCESIGGRYDGEQCWYAGKVTNIDDLMGRVYGD